MPKPDLGSTLISRLLCLNPTPDMPVN